MIESEIEHIGRGRILNISLRLQRITNKFKQIQNVINEKELRVLNDEINESFHILSDYRSAITEYEEHMEFERKSKDNRIESFSLTQLISTMRPMNQSKSSEKRNENLKNDYEKFKEFYLNDLHSFNLEKNRVSELMRKCEERFLLFSSSNNSYENRQQANDLKERKVQKENIKQLFDNVTRQLCECVVESGETLNELKRSSTIANNATEKLQLMKEHIKRASHSLLLYERRERTDHNCLDKMTKKQDTKDEAQTQEPQGGGGNKRLQQTQAQVDEVVGIMKVNVEKVLERDQNLAKLDDRADKLQVGASQFEQSAGKLKNKYWWKNMKMMIILGVVMVILIAIVIVWVVSKTKKPDGGAGAPSGPALPMNNGMGGIPNNQMMPNAPLSNENSPMLNAIQKPSISEESAPQ
ncbi:hypothetical protein SNEBB_009343 [Seison nebaliae]|nr:hypothetical protein SNEBB_009343 [Seison nebaliae]